MEFIEAECKTIINHVPGNYLPFNWSINPYRGCSHACSYCVGPETPVLMADGRAEPIAEVQVGDAITGTIAGGAYRRYTWTQVVAQWSTVKPGYRIFLEDGTMLVASGDHRFLTDRGWKYVTGSQQGRSRRPHLTINNKLMGTGGFAPGPKGGGDYRRGYLCGMIRGDGHLGAYRYERPGRRHGDVFRFRLALVDDGGVERTRWFLADHGVQTKAFEFSRATAAHKAAHAIRTSREVDVAAIWDLIRWPTDPTSEWAKGFLAGIFDAEGSFSGSLRISNTNAPIIRTTASSLRRLGFAFRLERTANDNGLVSVRLLGGLREAVRFFHTVDPAITRKRTFEGAAIKGDAPLRIESIEPLGFDLPMVDITTGTGDFIADGVVSHNCFARPTHTFLEMNAGSDFEKKIVVKVNAPEVLRRQLAAKRWKGEGIAMGTATATFSTSRAGIASWVELDMAARPKTWTWPLPPWSRSVPLVT